jgi:hypothetical protein
MAGLKARVLAGGEAAREDQDLAWDALVGASA